MITKLQGVLAVLAAGGAAAVAFASPGGAPKPAHTPPPPAAGGTVVQLCDGETNVEIDGALTPDKARAASAELMRRWRAKNPGARWDVAAAPTGSKPAPAGAKPGAPSAQQADTYGSYSARDLKTWEIETRKFIDKGDAIFHDAKQLGGTVAISCDMCHPNGANTHPETYPKFQVQLGRVALLRDMINWCIENPVKGKPFSDEDPRLRALEAYILAQRKGVALEYGKH